MVSSVWEGSSDGVGVVDCSAFMPGFMGSGAIVVYEDFG